MSILHIILNNYFQDMERTVNMQGIEFKLMTTNTQQNK